MTRPYRPDSRGRLPRLCTGGVALAMLPACLISIEDVRQPASREEEAGAPSAPSGPDAAPPSGVAEFIAQDQKNPYEIAVDSSTVFWTAGDGVFKVRKDGKPWFFPVYKGTSLHALAVDATFVYIADAGLNQITRVTKDGMMPTRLAAGQRPFGLAIDDKNVYWTNSADGTVMTVAKTGGATRVLATAMSAAPGELWGVALDTDSVYWSDARTRTVNKVAKLGGMVQVLATRSVLLHGIGVDADNVYWREGTNDTGKLVSVPRGGGAPVEIATQREEFPRGLAVDATGVYWSAGPPNDRRIERWDGKTLKVLATRQANAHSLAVDATHVYWTNWGGSTIWKVAKQ